MITPASPNPTKKTYGGLNTAYDFFNKHLFQRRLPRCLITMQRLSKAYGYFAGSRFGTRDGQEITDEIALNPAHLKQRSAEETLSTLVHEMTHLEQHHFGKPSRSGYHNRRWATLMKAVGLIPSDTGALGGKETGQQMTHYIEPGGRFAHACAKFIETHGFILPYVEIWSGVDAGKNKTKYTCSRCGLNAWAKPGVLILCGECKQQLEAERRPR